MRFLLILSQFWTFRIFSGFEAGTRDRTPYPGHKANEAAVILSDRTALRGD